MTETEKDLDTGMTPAEAVKVVRDWAEAAKRNPPPSGPFLEDDLRACATVLEDTIDRLTRRVEEAEAKQIIINTQCGSVGCGCAAVLQKVMERVRDAATASAVDALATERAKVERLGEALAPFAKAMDAAEAEELDGDGCYIPARLLERAREGVTLYEFAQARKAVEALSLSPSPAEGLDALLAGMTPESLHDEVQVSPVEGEGEKPTAAEIRHALSAIKALCAGDAAEHGWAKHLQTTRNRMRIMDICDEALGTAPPSKPPAQQAGDDEDGLPLPRVDALALAKRLAEKKTGHRSFPSLNEEVNVGWLLQAERDCIVTALRAYYDEQLRDSPAQQAGAGELPEEIKLAITEAMSWHPSESGPSYTETRNDVETTLRRFLASPSARDAALEGADDMIDIVFDGPPGHEAGRFVEVESPPGRGIRFGEWVKREDGYWALRFASPSARDAALEEAAETAEKFCPPVAPGARLSVRETDGERISLTICETKHTPGPWKISGPYHYAGDLHPSYRIDSNYLFVASVFQTDYRAEANASMIAAAPDLLAALAELVKAIDAGALKIESWLVRDPSGDPEAAWPWHEEWLHNAAKRALAKAEGAALASSPTKERT